MIVDSVWPWWILTGARTLLVGFYIHTDEKDFPFQIALVKLEWYWDHYYFATVHIQLNLTAGAGMHRRKNSRIPLIIHSLLIGNRVKKKVEKISNKQETLFYILAGYNIHPSPCTNIISTIITISSHHLSRLQFPKPTRHDPCQIQEQSTIPGDSFLYQLANYRNPPHRPDKRNKYKLVSIKQKKEKKKKKNRNRIE